jgi:hypothetical protein
MELLLRPCDPTIITHKVSNNISLASHQERKMERWDSQMNWRGKRANKLLGEVAAGSDRWNGLDEGEVLGVTDGEDEGQVLGESAWKDRWLDSMRVPAHLELQMDPTRANNWVVKH